MIVSKTKCRKEEINISNIVESRYGTCMAWIRCPPIVAVDLTDKDRINIGWTIARLEIQKNNPVQCHKCWHFGHTKYNCLSNITRTDVCFRCGIKDGHKAKDCTRRYRCIVCADNGYDTTHKIGSNRCNSTKYKEHHRETFMETTNTTRN